MLALLGLLKATATLSQKQHFPHNKNDFSFKSLIEPLKRPSHPSQNIELQPQVRISSVLIGSNNGCVNSPISIFIS